MKLVIVSTLFVAALSTVGCVHNGPSGVPHFDPSKPIERTHGWRQDGERVNVREVESELLQEPQAGRYIRQARTWSTVSLVLAGVGGGLVGWPIGEAIAGDPDPAWELSAVGGGVVAVSFLLIPVVSGRYNHAIDAHNELVSGAQVSLANGHLRLSVAPQGLSMKF